MNNNAYKHLDPSFNLHKGSLVIHKGNDLKHELAKFLVYWEESKNGCTVISEARFNNGCRADLYVVGTNTAIEILNTESEESIERKKKKYPCNVVFLNCDTVINYWLDKLNK